MNHRTNMDNYMIKNAHLTEQTTKQDINMIERQATIREGLVTATERDHNKVDMIQPAAQLTIRNRI